MAKKVLITGMSGLIGGLLKNHLTELGGYELTALNRSSVAGVRTVQADISYLEPIKPAFEGQDAVVHLAAYLGGQDWEGQHSGNVVGTHNVFEAARQAGVKRVIFASSGNAIRGFENVEPYKAIAEGRYDDVPTGYPMITHEQVWPEALYGATKVWGEALARHYSDEYGMSIICVRIGRVNKENRPMGWRDNATYLSHRDISQNLQKCIDAPDSVVYDIVFAVSDNRWGYRDLSHAKEVIGFEPEDSAERDPFTG
ncbi:MAG: NAD(P)-dependent oxidoreductase [SAR202 cluster bacterium]|nr:NAD(P)-dependent oxidoreductase [SAR202 cluster bacterium]MDP7105017.1 NAD(P)-dependent oxidoreductase [SAR202 cluster bacterium]MDP7532377.1 NAD(P)-dependent oxidoreductase [SAR202 cluster bacterium]